MRKLVTLAAVATAIAIGTAGLTAQTAAPAAQTGKPITEAAGKWNLSVLTDGGSQDSVLTVKIDGQKVSGTVASQAGELPIAGETAGGKLMFTLAFPGANGNFNLGFTGTLNADDTLTGSVDVSGTMQLNFRATRIKDAQAAPAPPATPPAATKGLDITGKWTMALDLQVGQSTPGLSFKQDGEKITGVYSSSRYGDNNFTGTLKGKTLQFSFTIDASGTSVDMQFSGEVAADGQSMKGSATIVGLGDATWTATKNKGI